MQGVVVGIVGGLGKPIVVPGPLGMVVGRMGCRGVLLGSPRIVVEGTGNEGATGSPGIAVRPGVAMGMEGNPGIVAGRMPGIEGTTGTVGLIGITGSMGTPGTGIAGLVGGTGTVGTAGFVSTGAGGTGIGRTGTGGTGTVGTMATGGRTGKVGTLGVPTGSAGKIGMGRVRLGNPGRPGNTNGSLDKIPAPVGKSVPELGVTPLDDPVGRLAIVVDGTIGAVSNKLVSISVAVGISIPKDFGRICKMTFAHEYRGLGCW